MAILENDYLKVAVTETGAQLTSFYNKEAKIEHLWQADANIWPWHAPNLFPVVGGLVNDELHAEGKTYPMTRHGFARQSEFLILEASDSQAKFSLPYCDNTLAVYPYKFDFQVHYDLIENSLRVTYKVINMEQRTISFSVGGHPAFNIPFGGNDTYEDYYLEFESTEPLKTYLLSAEGYFTGETAAVALNGNTLPLTRDMFAHDALVFKNLQSRQVVIKSTKHAHSIAVEFPHFNYIGLWGKPGANFVCIEPWLGCADSLNAVDISQKEGIQKLDQGHVFEAAYFISI
jgi:galactose mutarotase-like enzyme